MNPTGVEPTAAIMIGLCTIRGPDCTAPNTPQPITAVWTYPGRTQVNVCGACFTQKVKSGEWVVGSPKAPRPPIDMRQMESNVRWAKVPQNQATRAELITYLKREIVTLQVEWKNHPDLRTLQEWVNELEAIK